MDKKLNHSLFPTEECQMKVRVLLVVSMLVFLVVPALAQQPAPPAASEETVVVRKSDLTAEQVAKLQQQQVKETLGAYREYAEMGRGVGLAVGESLKAVKDVAVDLSQTDVGKVTMFLIAWKVMAKDVIGMGDMLFGYIVGIPLLFVGGLVWLWSYNRQCVPRRVLVEKTKEGNQKWEVFVPNQL
ncbi:MAG: hypothetical protein AAB780_01985, partial [Patescibacteria group bacterium]